MAEICDPYGGWERSDHVWAHCRGDEEACITVELLGIGETHALVKIDPSWESAKTIELESGDYKEYNENGTVWRVYCAGLNISQNLAKIIICYDEDEVPSIPCSDHETQAVCEASGCYWYDGSCHSTPEGVSGDAYDLPLYGTVTVLGNRFTNTKLLCATAQAVIRPEGLAAKTLVVGGAAVIFAVSAISLPQMVSTAVIMGGIGMKLMEIDAACTEATVEIFNAAYTEDDHDEVVQEVVDALEDAGFDATSEEVEDAVRKAEAIVENSAEEKQRQEDVINGVITPEQAAEEREAQIIDETLDILLADNFSLEIPTFVMAGEIDVSGSAPMQNQEIQIMAVKKFFGFDWLASDTELKSVTSDGNYHYEATLTLDEFGIIEVYSRIPKEWWELLDKDIETTRHTIFVLTWEMLIFLIIVAALVYDKASGGKLQKLFKKR